MRGTIHVLASYFTQFTPLQRLRPRIVTQRLSEDQFFVPSSSASSRFHIWLQKDDPTLWLKYRDHGIGQTKLSLLKNLSADSVPRFIDLELLEALANEDKWLEFQDMNLGACAEKNPRTIATEANVKDVYDAYYDLCSGYTHGHWLAIRDASFTICYNPLHRFHRIPSPINFGMRSIIDDGILLLNRMLDELSKIYPGLNHRISIEPDSAAENEGAPAKSPE